MILYYTATNNSEYIAKRVASHTNDTLINLTSRIKTHDHSPLHSEEPFIFVYPTYSWQMPRLLQSYIQQTPFTGNPRAYFITTCGASMGNMPKYIQNLCQQKQFTYMGCAEIVMPENYIALFRTPDRETALQIIQNAEPAIQKALSCIQQNHPFPHPRPSLLSRLSSGIVNRAFYSFIISAKKFHATDACTGCGKCTQLCPLNNIRITNQKPQWGSQCTHCMACISKCPSEAIEYGKKSKGKPRYQCPL